MTIATLTTDMQSHCVGRYLIDLPKNFASLNVIASMNRFSPPDMDFQEAPEISLALHAKEQTEMQYVKAVQQVLAKNSVPGPTYKGGIPRLVHTEKLTPSETLIRLYGDRYNRSELRVSEIHFFLEGYYAVASTESYEGKFAIAERHLNDFVRNIKIYDPAKKEKGFCIGPLLVQGRYSREEWSTAFRRKENPDVLIDLDMKTYVEGGETTLLQRADDPKNLLNIFDVSYSTLRKGRLKVADMQAEELAVRFSDKDEDGNKFIEHKLMLEIDRKTPSEAQPHISMRIVTGLQHPDTGERLSASLSDAELMATWDAIVKSIRLRPGAV